MFNNIFSNKGRSLSGFLNELKKGNRDFFNALNVRERSFEDATFEELMQNTADVLSEVSRVQKTFNRTFFDFFNGCLVKHHDNGDRKIIFYTTTDQAEAVLKIHNEVVNVFGTGYTTDNFSSFKETDKVKLLAKGLYDEDEGISDIWINKDLVILLQYKTAPPREFSLFITIQKKKTLDLSQRDKGTILQLLKVDIFKMMAIEDPVELVEEDRADGKMVKKVYVLGNKELGIFDRVQVRYFDKNVGFTHAGNIIVNFFSSSKIDPDKIIEVSEKIINIYGKDDSGDDGLKIHETEKIEDNGEWLGRRWTLNENHSLYDKANTDNKISYSIALDMFLYDYGFTVEIMGYKELLMFKN